jgi:hypothetical protein
MSKLVNIKPHVEENNTFVASAVKDHGWLWWNTGESDDQGFCRLRSLATGQHIWWFTHQFEEEHDNGREEESNSPAA